VNLNFELRAGKETFGAEPQVAAEKVPRAADKSRLFEERESMKSARRVFSLVDKLIGRRERRKRN